MHELAELEYYLEHGCREIGLELSREQLALFKSYYCLLARENEKINITTITGEKDTALKHFVDSLACTRAVKFYGMESMVDMGTGGGFPGLPLKIMYSPLKISLVDSRKKRVNFLEKVITNLQLQGARVYHKRAEDFGKLEENRGYYDTCASRALASLEVLAEYCLPVVKKGGFFLALKGPDPGSEINNAQPALDILGGEAIDLYHYKLPFVNEYKTIVIIKKIKETPSKYPRKAGIPEKRPLI